MAQSTKVSVLVQLGLTASVARHLEKACANAATNIYVWSHFLSANAYNWQYNHSCCQSVVYGIQIVLKLSPKCGGANHVPGMHGPGGK